MSRHILTTLMIGAATLTLMACAGATTHKPMADTSSKNPYDAKITAALERAADQAGGGTSESLAFLERLYKRDSKNPDAGLKYAQALRNTGNPQKAVLVLEPFANDKEASSKTLTEYATLQLGLAKYPTAETYARRAIAKDADSYKAYQVLGISLDAQNKYTDAEVAFRKALDIWQGDPIPVMNNLALNLTNQERLPEALDIMERAKAAAPDRIEVERNLRIIRTLNESADGRPAPKPMEKPNTKPVDLKTE